MFGLDGELTIPYPAFLIEHDQGLVLFDTGLPPEAADDPAAVFGEFTDSVLGITADPSQRIDRQLEALGFAVSDVTHVVLSHLHSDHAGGAHLFPYAKFYVGDGELAFAHYPEPICAPFYDLQQLNRIRGFDWHVVPGVDVDLFGDGALTLLSTPGHTPGELSLLVRLTSQTFILTGDAVHVRAALEREYTHPVDVDTVSALRSLRRLKWLADSERATIWIAHDPEDWAQMGHAPACCE
jgi:glyoxylase-like metal-dependent hydrolase (beta-lactamase superfamily II)